MGISGDRAAYTELYDILDRALASPRGLQIVYLTESAAKSNQFRFNKARQLDRALNKSIHANDPNHPMYNRTQYAELSFNIARDFNRDRWLLRLEKVARTMEIEEIPAPEPEVADLDGDDTEPLE